MNIELLQRNVSANGLVLAQLKANMSAARVKLMNDSSLLAKQERLWEQNVGSKNELDQHRLAYETSNDSHLAAVKAYDETRTRLRTDLAST